MCECPCCAHMCECRGGGHHGGTPTVCGGHSLLIGGSQELNWVVSLGSQYLFLPTISLAQMEIIVEKGSLWCAEDTGGWNKD